MKAKILLSLFSFIVVVGYLIATIPSAVGQEPVVVCQSGFCWRVPVVAPVVVQPVIPAQVYIPQVQYVPYQYQGSNVWQREYPTPLRNLFFGRYRVQHMYAPVQPAQ